MSNLQMENIQLRIKTQKMELEINELKKELEKVLSAYAPLPELDFVSIFKEIEKKADTEDTIKVESETGIYRPLANRSRKRDRDILIALSSYNGLTRDEIGNLFFPDHKGPEQSANHVMLRLVRDGHVRVDKKTSPYTYYSKYQIKRPVYEGYIYVIKEFHSNTYKIGKSKNIEDRLRMFNVKLPFKWELVHSVKTDDYTLSEKLIQDLFSDKRIKGTEWFNLDDKDLEIIKSNNFKEDIKKHLIDA